MTRLEQLDFTDDDARILMKSSALRELDEGDAAVFRPYSHVVLLPRGDKLFDTGDLGDSVTGDHRQGQAHQDRAGRQGEPGQRARIGDMFGELAMFDPTYHVQRGRGHRCQAGEIAHSDLRAVLAHGRRSPCCC
jgi:hypothetical protein